MVSLLSELLASYGGQGRPDHSHCANDTFVINSLLKTSYNKVRSPASPHLAPFQHYLPAHPTQVRVDMWVQEVTSVSELTQDFEIGERVKSWLERLSPNYLDSPGEGCG